jgi:hypothetical protein
MGSMLNSRLVVTDCSSARRGGKHRVNGVVEIAEQSAQVLLSYLGCRDLDHFPKAARRCIRVRQLHSVRTLARHKLTCNEAFPEIEQ